MKLLSLWILIVMVSKEIGKNCAEKNKLNRNRETFNMKLAMLVRGCIHVN